MVETQIILRLDKEALKELDRHISASGFKTRNEWFRTKVREFLEDAKKKEMLKRLSCLNAKGISEEEITEMVGEWRRRKTGK